MSSNTDVLLNNDMKEFIHIFDEILLTLPNDISSHPIALQQAINIFMRLYPSPNSGPCPKLL